MGLRDSGSVRAALLVQSTPMGKALEKIGDFFDDPYEHPVVLWVWGISAAYGLLDGIYQGFISAGIGGAIAYGFGGLLLGVLGGFLLTMVICFAIQAIPVIGLILLIYGIVRGVQALWVLASRKEAII